MEWLNLSQCLHCRGTLRRNYGGQFYCSCCKAPYPAAGHVPDFVRAAGDAATSGIEVDFDSHLHRPHGTLRSLYNQFARSVELRLIKREAYRLGRALDILDVGCGDPTRGNGTYHERLFPLARVYIGIDPSLPIASRVHLRPPIGFVRASGEIRVLRDEVVDIALSFRALDRCMDPNRTLANMKAALRPGGCILITLSNRNGWYCGASERVRSMVAWNSRPGDPRRRSKMSPNDLRQRLESVGFRDVELHSLLYLGGALQSGVSNWVVELLGKRWCCRGLDQVDRLGRFIAPQRGTLFIATARKPVK